MKSRYIFLKAKAPACNCFKTTTNNSFGSTSVATRQLLTLPRQADTLQCPVQHLLLLVEWSNAGVFELE